MSTSSAEPSVLAYWRERLPTALFIPVALLLAAPALTQGAAAMAKSFFVAYLLVFQFRLWDDLVDRERDRVSFPDRVLVRGRSLVPFYVFLLLLATVSLFLLYDRAIVYLVALMAFSFWYRWIAQRVPSVVRYHAVLLKYPLFTYLASSAGVAAMALVYFTFAAYEPLHDRSLRSKAVAFLDIVSWFVLILLRTSVFVAIPAAAIAAVAVRQVHRDEDAMLAGRALFVVSFVSLLITERVRS